MSFMLTRRHLMTGLLRAPRPRHPGHRRVNLLNHLPNLCLFLSLVENHAATLLSLLLLVSSTKVKVLPSMMSTRDRFCFTASHLMRHSVRLLTSSIFMFSSATACSPQERLMHSAVSTLSPVIIHILIFALLRASIVGFSLF